MADLTHVIESVVGGLLTGGTSAVTTFLTVVKDTKKRLALLEEKVGTVDPKTGIYLALSLVEDTTKKLRREVDSWEDDPPDWAKRLLARTRMSSSNDLSGQIQFEDRMDRNMKEFRDRLKRVEDDIEAKIERIEHEVETQLPGQSHGRVVSRDEYVKDSQQRAEEMLKIREQLATANGLLRGVLSALGYIDTDKPKLPGGR
jgi:hypothetical protein